MIFGCPEGYSNFRENYPGVVGELPFEIVHITEFLLQRLENSAISFKKDGDTVVTFHDPCRLGRRTGMYEEPRKLINLIADGTFQEMENNRENAVCCGTTAWMECSSCSKTMQTRRLLEAQQVGARTLLTACPKCQIHLTCAKSNTDIDIEIKDLYSYLAEKL